MGEERRGAEKGGKKEGKIEEGGCGNAIERESKLIGPKGEKRRGLP